jgi:hypothetical protein
MPPQATSAQSTARGAHRASRAPPGGGSGLRARRGLLALGGSRRAMGWAGSGSGPLRAALELLVRASEPTPCWSHRGGGRRPLVPRETVRRSDAVQGPHHREGAVPGLRAQSALDRPDIDRSRPGPLGAPSSTPLYLCRLSQDRESSDEAACRNPTRRRPSLAVRPDRDRTATAAGRLRPGQSLCLTYALSRARCFT